MKSRGGSCSLCVRVSFLSFGEKKKILSLAVEKLKKRRERFLPAKTLNSSKKVSKGRERFFSRYSRAKTNLFSKKSGALVRR